MTRDEVRKKITFKTIVTDNCNIVTASFSHHMSYRVAKEIIHYHPDALKRTEERAVELLLHDIYSDQRTMFFDALMELVANSCPQDFERFDKARNKLLKAAEGAFPIP